MKTSSTMLLALAGSLAPSLASAAVSEETVFVFNTLLFLIGGFLVMFMAAGFAMLEAGSVRSRSVASIVLKNVGLYAVAGLLYFLMGYHLMYTGVDGGYVGTLASWFANDAAVEAGDFSSGYASSSDWFFQMVFVATAASIVSGTLAERVKIWPFMIFSAVLTGVLYPITGAWKWGGGWLDAAGFQDFAGSTIVHSVGGWAALVGAILLGARQGRFAADGTPNVMHPSNIAFIGLGTFILWLGWFGFNGASQLALGSAADAVAVSNIFANTNIAAAAGVVVTMIACHLRYGKIDVVMTLNGALAGLVSITAEPLMPNMAQAAVIGGVGGLLVVIVTPLLEKLKIDDVVGAVPVHLAGGIWGTMIVPLTNPDASYLTQLTGVAAVGVFTVVASFLVFSILKMTVGLRLTKEQEDKGADLAELQVTAYNIH